MPLLFGPRSLRYFYLGEVLLFCSEFVTSSFPLCPLSVILYTPPSPPAYEVDQFITGQRRSFTLSVLEPHPPWAALLMKGGTASQSVQGDLRGQEVQFQKQLGEVITPPTGPLRDAPPAGRSNSHILDSYSWACGLASIIRKAPEPGCCMTQDEGDATGSAQRALALVASIGESMGGSVPNSAEGRRKWGDGRGGALTGRAMNCQREMNNEGKVGSRWPAVGLPRRDRDRLTSRLALTKGHPLVTDVLAVKPEAGEVDVWMSIQHTVEEIVKAWPLALVWGFGNGAKKICIH